MDTHTGSRIAGDSISIFDREFGENEAEINEEELDQEVYQNDTMIIIVEDEGHEGVFDLDREHPDVICIED